MAHGRTSLQSKATRDRRPAWLAALDRGIVLGLVVSLHLGLLLLLGPLIPYRARPDTQLQADRAPPLRLRLLPKLSQPRRPGPLPLRPVYSRPVITRRVSVAAAVAHKTAAQVSIVTRVAPAPVAGDYHSPLLSGAGTAAMGSAISGLPGSDTPYAKGFALDDTPSLQQFVRKMPTASRCSYEKMKMARSPNQFVTRQLMDRALEADGCGPSAPRTAADKTVDAISHRAIFGD
jgi:hypothetical protein